MINIAHYLIKKYVIMKQSLIKVCAALLGLVVLYSCNNGFEDCHNTIMMKNNSSSDIYYYSSLKEDFFNYDPTNPTYAVDLKVNSSESKKLRIGISLSCWEQTLESAGGYVFVYIYDAEYLEATPWQDAKNNYLKKYKLNADDLSKKEWSIVYP